MAQYFTDFAGNSVGSSPPTDWTERWEATGFWGVGTGPVAEWVGSFPSRFDFLSWDTPPGSISGDCEILVLFRSTDTGGTQGGVCIHSSTSATSGYSIGLGGTGANLVATRIDAGAETILVNPSFTWAADTDYWLRVQRSSNSLRARAWADGGSEPGTWLIDTTDSTYTSGSLGLFARSFAGTKSWSKVGVGTGGDSAPAATVGYTLTANAGSYALTGQSATTSFASILTAAQGSYTLTGVEALLVKTGSYQFNAEAGSYTLVGANALVDVSMNAEAGSYTLTGQAATLNFAGFTNPTLTAEFGSYSLTGFASNILYGRILPAETGSYALTGRQAGLIWSGAPVATGYASQKMTISSLRISL